MSATVLMNHGVIVADSDYANFETRTLRDALESHLAEVRKIRAELNQRGSDVVRVGSLVWARVEIFTVSKETRDCWHIPAEVKAISQQDGQVELTTVGVTMWPDALVKWVSAMNQAFSSCPPVELPTHITAQGNCWLRLREAGATTHGCPPQVRFGGFVLLDLFMRVCGVTILPGSSAHDRFARA